MSQSQKTFLCLVLVLLGFGALMVHSSSMTSRPGEQEQIYLSRHLLFLTGGVLLGGIASLLRPRDWLWLAPVLFGLTVMALVAVLVPGVGTRVNGAQRWFRIGSVSLQPSELAKVTLPLMICAMFEYWPKLRQERLRGLWGPLIPMGIVVPLVLLEPDFGTGLFLLLGGLLALFVRGWPLRNFAIVCGSVLPLVVFVGVYKPYQLRRITGFIASWTDLNQAPYQLQQSLATMGSGGLTGMGLGRGWQKLSYLPEANTDFVFAVIGEELGLFGTCAIVGLWLGMFVVGRKMLARGADSEFSFAVGMTLLVQIVMQAAVNMAVVTALVPPKGISHPLVSRGGSNLLVNLIALGMLLSFSRCPERPAEMATADGLTSAP